MIRKRLSPSQISKFDTDSDGGCVRRWVGEYLHGWPSPSNSSAQLGTRVHAIAEAWLLSGAEPDQLEVLTLPLDRRPANWTGKTDERGRAVKDHLPGQIFAQGMHLLPPPGVSVCEGKFTFETEAADWGGTRDFYTWHDRSGIYYLPVPGCNPDRSRVLLGDHKTTSAPQYAKDAADLLGDTQGNLYAWDLMDRFGVDELDARWVYYLTTDKPSKPSIYGEASERKTAEHARAIAKWDAWVAAGKPKAWAVDVTYTRAAARAKLAKIEAKALQLYEIRARNPKPQEVPPNSASCDAFGGCPHRGTRCELTVDDVWEGSNVDQKLMDFFASKGVATDGGNKAPPPPAPPAPPVVEYWQPGDRLNDDQEYMASKGKSLGFVAQMADRPPPDAIRDTWPGAQLPYAEGVALHKAPAPPAPESGTINPPEAPKVAAATPEQAAQLQGVAPIAPPVPQTPAQDDGRDTLKRQAMALGLVDGSSKMGAKGLAKLIADHEASQAKPTPPSVDPRGTETGTTTVVDPDGQDSWQDPPRAEQPAIRPIRTLYVNCLPVGGYVAPFSQISDLALAQIRSEHQIQHYGLVDYGKGPALFAAAVELAIAGDTINGLAVDTRSREGADALAVLERMAETVIRGF